MDVSVGIFEDEFEVRRSEPTSPWPVDTAHLARFTLGDETLEREVLGLFTGESPRRIEAMRRARSDKDWKMATHTLKGSARAVGAWRLAKVAQDAERLGGISDQAACARAILGVEKEAAEAEAYIKRLYPPHA